MANMDLIANLSKEIKLVQPLDSDLKEQNVEEGIKFINS